MPVSWNKDLKFRASSGRRREQTSLSRFQCRSDVRAMRPGGQIANRSQIALSLAPGPLQVGILYCPGSVRVRSGCFPCSELTPNGLPLIFLLLDGSVALLRSRLHAIERCAGGAELRIRVQGCLEFAGGVFGPFFAAED